MSWRARADCGDGVDAAPAPLDAPALDIEAQLLLANTLAALQRVGTEPGSGDLAFIRELRGTRPAAMSEKQRAHVLRLAWRYRCQLPAGLRPACNPDAETK